MHQHYNSITQAFYESLYVEKFFSNTGIFCYYLKRQKERKRKGEKKQRKEDKEDGYQGGMHRGKERNIFKA